MKPSLLAGALLLAALLPAACAPTPAGYDPVTMDPPRHAGEPPASMAELAFESDGARLNAILYRPAGAGPHPVVILLHGYPGNERNLDLAHALRRAGWAVLFFHYRGAWGSGGDFSFGHALEDVGAAVALVRTPRFAGTYGLDAETLALVGHSMGGFLALRAGADLAPVDCVVSLAGSNLGLTGRAVRGDPALAAAAAERLAAWGGPIRDVNGERLVAEVAARAEEFDLRGAAPALAERRLLLVAGERDDVVPPDAHHAPLVAALEGAGAPHLRTLTLDADHAFSNVRIALARAVVAFLEEDCAP